MTGNDITTTQWIKASRSGGNGGNCVEMRRTGTTVQVRDSKNPHGDLLAVPAAQFTAWVRAAATGEFSATAP